MPASSFSWLASRTTTSQPACAQIWAMPWPMSPQPTTPTLPISISGSPPSRSPDSGSGAYSVRECGGLADFAPAQLQELVDGSRDVRGELAQVGQRLRVGV